MVGITEIFARLQEKRMNEEKISWKKVYSFILMLVSFYLSYYFWVELDEFVIGFIFAFVSVFTFLDYFMTGIS